VQIKIFKREIFCRSNLLKKLINSQKATIAINTAQKISHFKFKVFKTSADSFLLKFTGIDIPRNLLIDAVVATKNKKYANILN
jgi:hypothetical protein